MQKDQAKAEWTAILSQGKQVTLSWDCGGDETIIEIAIDGKEVNNPLMEVTYDEVADKLELPNVGEWFVKGSGKLLLQKGKVVIEHESIGSGLDYENCEFDDDGMPLEETCKEIEKPISGKCALFEKAKR